LSGQSTLYLESGASLEIAGDLILVGATLALSNVSSVPPIFVKGCLDVSNATLEVPMSALKSNLTVIVRGFNASCSSEFGKVEVIGSKPCVVPQQYMYPSSHYLLILQSEIHFSFAESTQAYQLLLI